MSESICNFIKLRLADFVSSYMDLLVTRDD
jgi:hypothetical protein